jgi:HEAT repeat protein
MRRAAVAALGELAKAESRREAAPVLDGLLADPDLLVQTAAVRSIGALRLASSVPALRLAVGRTPMLREEIDLAIRRIEAKNETKDRKEAL